jgi:hypothetical protein
MAWVLVAWAVSLRAAINTIAPTRDKASDGSIGDQAHASGVSGHNPDDTPGTTAERQDADSIPEVRAIDVDKDLRQGSTITMLKIIQAILASPAERNRLIYIIFNRVIWSASNGWQPREYNGPNPHTEHAHFSGNPAADTNGSPWPSVLALGEDMATAEEIAVAVWARKISSPAMGVVDRAAADWLKAATGVEEDLADFTSDEAVRDAAELARDNADAQRDQTTSAKLDVLLARPAAPPAEVDPAQLDAAVRSALTDPTVVAPIAAAVADEIWRRMQPGT